MNNPSFMKEMVRSYYYFFYKICKAIDFVSEAFGGGFWTEFKAGAVIIVLEVWTCASIFFYSSAFAKNVQPLRLDRPIVFVLLAIILVVNCWLFLDEGRTKNYMRSFDELPRKVNGRGSWIVAGICLFLVLNAAFSVYLLSLHSRSCP